MDYLGLRGSWSKWDPTLTPIPSDHIDQLRDVLHWIFGYKPDDVQPVVQSQNPDIKRLGDVLKSRGAIAVLRSEKSLAKAFDETAPPDEKFSASLVAAQKSVRDAVASLQAYDGGDQSLLDIAGEIKESAEILHQRMRKKFEDARREG